MNTLRTFFLSTICTLTIAAPAQAPVKKSAEEIFTHIYTTNYWSDPESASGGGSNKAVTTPIRPAISKLISDFNIQSIIDAPCGDFNWMKLVDMGSCHYTGLDIVKPLIAKNNSLYANELRTFKHHNVITQPVEKADLILCRDLLAHLSTKDVYAVLRNFKKSGSTYLLVTTCVRTADNKADTETGKWRKINFQKAPFNFPQPLVLIEEDVPFEAERGKHLALWRLQDLPLK